MSKAVLLGVLLAALTLTMTGQGQAAAATAEPADVTGEAAAVPAEAPAAEESAPESMAEVTVTSSRLRLESAQETPIAVSVLSEQLLENLRGSADLAAISAVVPNLLVEPVGSAPGVAAISLRGFNTRTSDIAPEPGVAVYVDGVYQVINSGQLSDLYDIDRLEVLRGPQGTLLGKNAGAGAILITRSRPTGDWGGKVEGEYGSYNLIQVKGLLDFPIVPGLSGKVFVSYRNRDGYIRDLAVPGKKLANEDLGTVRGALLFKPSDLFDLYLTGDYIRDHSGQHPGRNVSDATTLGCIVFKVCNPHGGQYLVSSATLFDPTVTNESNITANANVNLSAVKLTSISGYRRYDQINSVDLDSVPEPIIQVPRQLTNLKQYSEELRLSSVDHGGLDLDGKLDWLVAGYFGHSRATQTLPLTAFGTDLVQSEKVVRNSRAVFGHADYKLFDPLTVNLGARHSWDYVDHGYSCADPASCNALGNAPVPLNYFQHARFQNNSFEAGLQYKLERDKMLYFRFAQGYRGGGFLGLPSSVEAAAVIIKPETSNSYEVGAKTEWLDGRQQLNLTLFNVKFKDMQRDIVLAGPNNTFIQATANAADATTRGVELESISKPIKPLTVRTNVGYLDAHYTRYNSLDAVTGRTLDLSGQPLTYAPKWTASLIPEYRIPLGKALLGFESVALRSNMTYRSSYTTSSVNNPIGHQGGFMMVDASLALEAGSYSVTGYVNNLTNKRYLVLGETVSGLIYHAIDNIDRTYGVTVAMHF